MDLLTVGIVLGLMAIGGGLVYWPMSLYLGALKEDLSDARRRNLELAAAISAERAIDDARDLEPAAELRVLLNADSPHESAASGPRVVAGRVGYPVRSGRAGDAPLPGPEEDPGQPEEVD